MGLLLFLVLSLLLARTSPLRDVPHSSCSTKLDEDHHHFNSSVLHLTLHHPRSPCSPASLHHLPFSTVLSHDDSRAQFLAARLTKTAPRPKSPLLDPNAATVPVISGMSLNVGNYITRIGLGTPSNSYVMVIDTGSSLTWLQCSPCRVCHKQVGSIFDPSSSSTYRSVSCSEPECDGLQSATLNPSACSSFNVCIYQASYGDSSFSVGYLAKDTLALGGAGRVLPNLVFGCGQDNEGLFGRSAGLIGLARNKLSLLAQLAPKLGNVFSYCLPTTASTGYLTIGSYPQAQYVYTPMVSSSLDNSLYFVRLTGITVGGKGIAVASSAYTRLPTIMDSGTVITRLPSDVYSALSKAVVAALSGHARAPAYSKLLDTCYKGSVNELAVPMVDMVFLGGAALGLPGRNVMVDVDSSTTCLAFAPNDTVVIIGNWQQQTFRVAYDVAMSRIGIAAGGCG